jgi:hypothetical protein
MSSVHQSSPDDATGEEAPLWDSRPLTAEEEFFRAWARESPKRNLALVNDLLGRLVTLATTLAGGSAAFLDERMIPPGLRPISVLCFLASLAFALVGVYPRGKDVPDFVEHIEQHLQAALSQKLWWLRRAAYFLVGGFAVVLIALLVRFFGLA